MEFPLWLPFENEWWTFCILLVSILTFVIGSELILNFGFLSPESNRRLVHVTIGTLVTLSPLIFSRSNEPSMLALAFIILNILAFNDERFKGIHSQRRITYGTIYFPIAYLILTMGFWQYTEFMIISLSLLALSDPFAAFIGERISNKIEFIVWDDKKTLQGTVAFFFSALCLVYFISQLLFNYSNMYLLLFAVFTATGATIAEITSSKGSDNISIPIVTMLFMIGFFEIIPSSKELMIDVLLSEKIVMIIVIIFLFYIAYLLKALTSSGFSGGLVMGIIIVMLGHQYYLIPIAIFFILSSLLSKILKNTSFYITKGSRRDIIQVYANGGIALLICTLDHFNENPILIFLFFSSIAAAMSVIFLT